MLTSEVIDFLENELILLEFNNDFSCKNNKIIKCFVGVLEYLHGEIKGE